MARARCGAGDRRGGGGIRARRSSAQIGFAQTILTALGYAGSHVGIVTRAATRSPTLAARGERWRRPRRSTCAGQAHHARFRHRSPGDAGADAQAGDRAAGRARRSARSRSTRSAARCAWRASGACPEAALIDATETPALRFIERTACSAAFARAPVPRTRFASCRASPWRRRPRRACAQRGRAVQLRALRQAFRHAPDGRGDARRLGGHSMFAGRERAATAADVRRLPGGRHDGEQDRGQRSRFTEMDARRIRRGPNFYRALSRLFYAPPDCGPARAALGSADELQAEDATLATSWRELCVAAAGARRGGAARGIRRRFSSARARRPSHFIRARIPSAARMKRRSPRCAASSPRSALRAAATSANTKIT